MDRSACLNTASIYLKKNRDKSARLRHPWVFLSAIDKIKQMISEQIMQLLNPKGIYERSDADVRKLEGLPISTGLLCGIEPSGLIKINENGYSFLIDIKEGQKSGFFLDQRINRKAVANYARGLNILDCFSYTGGFSINAMGEGASSTICIDSSSFALNMAKENFLLNSISKNVDIVEGNVFDILRKYRDSRKFFDMIILDPPKLAPTKAHKEQAARAYKDMNLLAMKLLNADGILATFSCSGGIDTNYFKEILLWASIDADREVQIIESLSASSDHPIRLSFPESEYLKGFILRII
ncbi:class I SAM-dependent rRNA methyltransferase [Candidatus Poribacteria bacterium]|nr:class I SAM-dependent rRNA methyltransferase [Candidatus Poribacteria bacterium]